MGKVYVMSPEMKRRLFSNIDSDKMELNFGLFFDGTQNSIANIDERKGFEEFKRLHTTEGNAKVLKKRGKLYESSKRDSYRNEYTNVARFYTCSKKPQDNSIIPIYIEGIGTKPRKIGEKIDYEKKPPKESKSYTNYNSTDRFIEENEGFIACTDDSLASALGVGLFGVKKKVEAACEKIALQISERLKCTQLDGKEDLKLIINIQVFGFSRGASAARCFSASLRERLGKTNVTFSTKTLAIGANTRTYVSGKLEQENKYKTSLCQDWLDECLDKFNKNSTVKVRIWSVRVKFLGLYDTVSSYGASFDDDVEELSLKINNNVRRAVQICAGDEYRLNFALTDISSAGEDGEMLLLPGSHSDIGGGYAQNKTECLNRNLCTSGRKGVDLLWKEGWFERNEDERVVSNLYSVIPFLLMKERIPEIDVVFDMDKLKKYRLPIPGENFVIDGITHGYSEALCRFYEKLQRGEYDSYYEMKDGRIKCLSQEEHLLSVKIEAIEASILRFIQQGSIDVYLSWDEEKKKLEKDLERMREKMSTCDEELLRKIRHDFLHLSAANGRLIDLVVNAPNGDNSRCVIEG